MFEQRPVDAAGRRAALAAAVARLDTAGGVPGAATRTGAGHGASSLVGAYAGPLGGSSAAAASPVVSVSPAAAAPSPATPPGSPSAASRAPGPAASADGRGAIGLPEPLAELVPGGLRRGEALALGGAAVDYLSLALLAEALRQGLWCAAVGVAGLGGAALTGLLGEAAVRAGALGRLLVVAEPGEQWAQAATALADGVDLLLLRPPGLVPAQTARRVDARLRQGAADTARHRAALLVLGAWPSARTVLRVRRLGWTGIRDGTGHLTGGRAEITAEDRARRVRRVRLWLPAADGMLQSLPATTSAGRDPAAREEATGIRPLTAVA